MTIYAEDSVVCRKGNFDIMGEPYQLEKSISDETDYDAMGWHDTHIFSPDSLDDAEALVTTNVLAPLRLISALLPTLKQQSHATIVNVSSGLAFVPLALTPTYSATKAFIHSYTESLRYQLQGTKIAVLELAPPYVATELLGPKQAADDRAMPLDDFIAEVMDILANQPQAVEILVDRVKPLRHATGAAYTQVFEELNAMFQTEAALH